MVTIKRFFFILVFLIFFIKKDMCKMICEKNKSNDEIREALFDEAFNRIEIVSLNEEEIITDGQIVQVKCAISGRSRSTRYAS